MKSICLLHGSLLVVLGLSQHLELQAGPVPANKPAAYPAWWFERDVIKRLPAAANKSVTDWLTDYPKADDYAAVNQGQLKNIAKRAYEEMGTGLPGGAGSTLEAIWADPAASTDDYRALNLGQLKALAKPFYARLISLGLTTKPVWFDGNASVDNYALANIGQAKNLFSWDITVLPNINRNGIPDAWEYNYLGKMVDDSKFDSNSNGMSNIAEYILGMRPDKGATITTVESLADATQANSAIDVLIFTP
ncbi:MAG: sugar-binding protein [Opitutus sp.]|nr:sugar-binding protein [Opitutus sp.]MCS6275108.1 sugar-binding protein [Opitutus sp.]MCS6276764.1 sugar-binding protein [Opitutus sp.]MCS6301587.1 sugar-binding protein [Opitutus sp.]